MDKKILIADDEELLRQLICDFLKPEGYTVIQAADGKEAIARFAETNPDLVVLDVMMPGYDGWTVCRHIRQTANTPIIMLTAKSEELDQLLGFDLGVDEYITKPFSPKVLLARIKAIFRRIDPPAEPLSSPAANASDLMIDEEAHLVTSGGQEINLILKEYKLLVYLSHNPGKAISRRQLLNQVWGYDYFGDLRTVDTHINRIRGKLDGQGYRIQTIRGYGYRFEGAE